MLPNRWHPQEASPAEDRVVFGGDNTYNQHKQSGRKVFLHTKGNAFAMRVQVQAPHSWRQGERRRRGEEGGAGLRPAGSLGSRSCVSVKPRKR